MGAQPSLVTRTASGLKANGDSYVTAASANGRYVLFASDASNLYADSNGTRDVFRADLWTGALTVVNVLPSGVVEADTSFRKASTFLGPDGNLVLFSSSGALYLRDVAAASTTMLAATVSQDDYPLSWAPGAWSYANFTASASGRYVAFSSAAALVGTDTNGQADAYVLDLQAGGLTRVSVTALNGQANARSLHPVFSPDETWVQFNSFATNFVAGDTGKSDVFLKNLRTGELRMVSRGRSGAATDGHSFGQGFSADGRYALFESEATNIVAGDTNAAADVFAYDIANGRVIRVSVGANGEQGNGGSGFASAVPGTDIISFVSAASNLVPRDTNGARDVFFKQLSTGKIVTLQQLGGVQPNNETLSVVFSPDGGQAFVSTKASNLVAGDNDSVVDVVALPAVQVISLLTTLGTDGTDALTGSIGADVVRGLGGNDTLSGGAGDDLLDGGPGDDLLLGGDGDDVLLGGDGDDTLVGGSGNNVLDGGPGRDVAVFDFGFRGVRVTLADNGDRTVARASISADTVRGLEEMRFLDGRLVFDANDPAAQALRLYRAALGRDPDQGGLNFWISALQAGTPLQSLAAGFVGGGEFAARFGVLDAAGFATQLYVNVLGRAPDAAGLQYWTGMLRSVPRAAVLAAMSESDENKARTTAMLAAGIWDRDEGSMGIARLYQAVLGRTPDASGLGHWRGVLAGGGTLGDMADWFAASDEFQATYGALTAREFVGALYRNTLGRDGDAGGLDYWSAVLATRQMSRSAVVLGFSESSEHKERTAAAIGGEAAEQFGITLQ